MNRILALCFFLVLLSCATVRVVSAESFANALDRLLVEDSVSDASAVLTIDELELLADSRLTDLSSRDQRVIVGRLLNSRVPQYREYGLRIAMHLSNSLSANDRTSVAGRIIQLAVHEPDAQLRRHAIAAYVGVETDDIREENTLVDMAKSESEAIVLRDIARGIAAGGVYSDRANELLMSMAASPNLELSFSVTELLSVGLEEPPEDLLPILISHVRGIDNYGNPNLIQQIPKFGRAAADYLTILRDIRAKILSEVELDHQARSIQIYNDDFYVKTINDVVMFVEDERWFLASEQGSLK